MLQVLTRGRAAALWVVALAVAGLFFFANSRPADAVTGLEIAAIIGAIAALVRAGCGCRGGGDGGGGDDG